MTVRYACTFEFDTRSPLTHRGTVVAASGATCVARATREAQKALRPVNWTSLVCVLLERIDEPLAISTPPADGEALGVVIGTY